MESINWHSVIAWAVVIGAPILGGLIWIKAYGGPDGERRNKMWTQGPFVRTGEEKSKNE